MWKGVSGLYALTAKGTTAVMRKKPQMNPGQKWDSTWKTVEQPILRMMKNLPNGSSRFILK